MKHGDKEKGKASKATSKKAGKGSAAGKSSKAVQVSKSKTSPAVKSGKAAAAKNEAAHESGGNGKTKPRSGGDHGSFTNPVIAAAFKRAVKKYPNSFRKLSD